MDDNQATMRPTPPAPWPDVSSWRAWPEPPRATTVRRVRQDAELTQEQASRLLFVSVRRWQTWEYGQAPMHPAFYELFCRKLSELKTQVREIP